jgi:threonine dehydrogenase-like Zn-dependent dehydrogenase
MRQLTLIGEGALEWRTVDRPRLADPRGAIVRPIAVGVCDFDRAVVAGRYKALPHPIALGHEIVAEVTEIGEQVTSLSPGMQVVLPLHISCGVCAPCAAGHTNSCDSRPPFSNFGLGAMAGDWGGGMSDFLCVPYADAMAVPVPAGLTATDCAAIGCNLVDLHRSIAPYAANDARLLIVSGDAHNMALYGILMAKALGVASIDFADDDGARLDAAAALGANPLDLRAGRLSDLYPIVVDCSADPKRLGLALACVGHDGVCHNVWPHPISIPLPVTAMFLRNVTFVTGQPHARAHIEPVLDLMQTHEFGSTSIPCEVLPWEDAPTAFGFGESKRIFVRS